MKVSDLEGAELDYWVAKANTDSKLIHWQGDKPKLMNPATGRSDRYEPSRCWSQGGPIIERERGQITPLAIKPNCDWCADMGLDFQRHRCYGNTPLIAAMRAYVASKFGEDD